jgi:hypothetical protein
MTLRGAQKHAAHGKLFFYMVALEVDLIKGNISYDSYTLYLSINWFLEDKLLSFVLKNSK